MNQLPIHKPYRYIFLLVFILVFIYIILRAIYVPPVIDEVFSFFWYIKPGTMQPEYSFLDANNHILNSALSHLCYQLFGDGIFVIRIPNLIGFILYAFYAYRIYINIGNPFARILWMIFIFGTGYLIDFFSLSRGYGLSFAFLLGVFYHLHQQFTAHKIKDFAGASICNILMIFSNLALLTWSPVIFLTSLILLLSKRRKVMGYLLSFFILIIYSIAFFYLYNYATLLKQKGSLYLNGGNSFYEVIYLGLGRELGMQNLFLGQLLILSALILLGLMSILNIKRLRKTEIFAVIGFIGFNIGFILLNKLMGVNYPPDRSSIQIYLLLIFAYVLILNKNQYRWINYAACIPGILLLYIFISNLNLTHNTHWKEEAIPYSFIKKVATLNQSQNIPYSIGANPVDCNIWNYYNYMNHNSINFAKGHYCSDTLSDILIISTARKGTIIPSGYDTLSNALATGHLLLKKKNRVHHYSTEEIKDISSAEEFIPIYTIPPDSSKTKSVNIGIEFDLQGSGKINGSYLVISTSDEYHEFDTQLMNRNENLRFSYSFTIPPKELGLNMYIWNKKKRKIDLKDIKIYIEEIN